MKFKITPGMGIFVLGFCGLVFSLVESSGEIGSKVPLALFFTFVMGIGILLELAPEDKVDGVFGEQEERGGFG